MPDEPARENYFILLGVDPDAPWSDSEFARILAERRAQWTKELLSPRPEAKLQAKKNQNSLHDIQRVMTDPALREKERIEAKSLLAERKRDAQKRLSELLDLLALKGYLLDEEIRRLCKEFGDPGPLTEAAIHEEISERKIPNTPPDEAPPPDRLDPTILKEISANLAVFGKQDLYDFLDLVKTAKTPELLRRAKQLFVATVNSTKDSAHTYTQRVLSGYAYDVFRNEQKRRGYDKALDDEEIEALRKLVHQITAVQKRIHRNQFWALIDYAAGQGIDNERAAECILQTAQVQGILVDTRRLENEKTLRCSTCGHLNGEQKFCGECGAPLRRLRLDLRR